MPACSLEGVASFMPWKIKVYLSFSSWLCGRALGPRTLCIMGTAPVMLHHFKPIWEQTDGGQAKPTGSWVAMPITAMSSRYNRERQRHRSLQYEQCILLLHVKCIALEFNSHRPLPQQPCFHKYFSSIHFLHRDLKSSAGASNQTNQLRNKSYKLVFKAKQSIWKRTMKYSSHNHLIKIWYNIKLLMYINFYKHETIYYFSLHAFRSWMNQCLNRLNDSKTLKGCVSLHF